MNLGALPVSNQKAGNVEGIFSTPDIKQFVIQQSRNFNFYFEKSGLVEAAEKELSDPQLDLKEMLDVLLCPNVVNEYENGVVARDGE